MRFIRDEISLGRCRGVMPASLTAERESLARVIGTFGLAAGIINITIGGGIFRLPASIAGSLGPAAPLAYLVCALAMGLIVLCIADAGKRVSLTGGPYAYVGAAFGSYAGFISGVLLWMLGTFATAAVGTIFSSSLTLLTGGGHAMEMAILAAVFAFWMIVNLRGVTVGVRLNSIATIAKLVPLLLVAIGGAFFVETQNLRITTMPAAGDVARTCLLLIFAFAGIECALVPSGEVRDPARTVPRAIALAMAAVTVLYITLQMVAQGILGPRLAQSTVSPLADAAGVALGGWARTLLLAGAAISMFGYLGGMVLSMPRMLFALARDGFLPRALATVHPARRVPQTAIVVQVLIILGLALTGTFERLAILANASALALYFGCALAAWKLRRLDAADARGAGMFAIVPWLACAVILWLLTGLAPGEWIAILVDLLAASMLYLVATRRRQNTPAMSRTGA
jgi:basic amino acid/polyamine antiporter, APA family